MEGLCHQISFSLSASSMDDIDIIIDVKPEFDKHDMGILRI